jgi:tetratricopeptide (TPR) repeat protein
LADLVGQEIGRFKILEHVGSGGMGEVYRAHDPQLRRDVAIKRLPHELAENQERRQGFLNEARSTARITHQQVAGLFDVLEEGDELYLVMEYVAGTTLRERLRRSIELHEFLDIAVQSVEGLAAAHAEAIVHGDVKPENIMLGPQGGVKLVDFGVARWASVGQEHTYLTTDLAPVAGTVSYMPPEVLLGHRGDHRADIFALGVVFYEMLTDQHPFRGPTITATGDRILHEAPVPVSDVTSLQLPDLQAVLDKMLAKEPQERYATADDIAVDLRAIRAGLTDPAAQPGGPIPGRRRPRWAVAAAVAAPVIALALWMGTAFLAESPDPQEATPVAGAAFDASDWIIAVLPAAGVSDDDPEIQALNDGLVATLTARLTQLTRSHDLQVIPTSALRERAIDGLEMARQELGVTLVLNFEAHRAGDRVRVNLGLVDTRQLRQLDADTVDAGIDDLLSLEEQVSVRALRMLRIELLPMEQGLLAAGTDEPRAHAYYLRGRGYLEERGDEADLDTAVTLFEQALRVDPEYARAHAGLGRAFWRKYELTEDPAWVARATDACNEAAALGELDAAGRLCLGVVYNGTGRYADAAAELEQAVRLEPTDDAAYIELANAFVGAGELARAETTYEDAIAVRPHYWAGYSRLGVFYFRQGRIAEAIDAWEQAAQLAPDSYRSFSNLGAAYYYAERWVDARRAFERALEIKPDYTSAISNLGTLYFYEGRFADSARMFERVVESEDSDYLWWGNLGDAYYWAPGERNKASTAYGRAIELALQQLTVNTSDAEARQLVARYYAMEGARDDALEQVETALQLAPTEIDVLHAAAHVHNMLGERDKALDYLLRAIDAGYPRAEIRVDPVFADLLDEPRVRRALEGGDR